MRTILILPFLLSCLGLILGLFGSVLLAINLSAYLTMIKTALIAHEASIQTLAPDAIGDIKVFKGFQSHLDKLNNTSNQKAKIGIFLLATSFLIQLLSLLIQYFCCNLTNL